MFPSRHVAPGEHEDFELGRPREYDREQVLQKAMRLFWRKGYEGTHLAELVEATGLNRFSLYEEFGGKEGLFSEALDRYMLQLQPLTSLLLREPRGPGEAADGRRRGAAVQRVRTRLR